MLKAHTIPIPVPADYQPTDFEPGDTFTVQLDHPRGQYPPTPEVATTAEQLRAVARHLTEWSPEWYALVNLVHDLDPGPPF